MNSNLIQTTRFPTPIFSTWFFFLLIPFFTFCGGVKKSNKQTENHKNSGTSSEVSNDEGKNAPTIPSLKKGKPPQNPINPIRSSVSLSLKGKSCHLTISPKNVKLGNTLVTIPRLPGFRKGAPAKGIQLFKALKIKPCPLVSLLILNKTSIYQLKSILRELLISGTSSWELHGPSGVWGKYQFGTKTKDQTSSLTIHDLYLGKPTATRMSPSQFVAAKPKVPSVHLTLDMGMPLFKYKALFTTLNGYTISISIHTGPF